MTLIFDHLNANSQSETDAEMKVPSVENTELTHVLLLKPGVGQDIAIHASPTARNFVLVLIFTLPVHSPSFSPNPLPTFLTAVNMC